MEPTVKRVTDNLARVADAIGLGKDRPGHVNLGEGACGVHESMPGLSAAAWTADPTPNRRDNKTINFRISTPSRCKNLCMRSLVGDLSHASIESKIRQSGHFACGPPRFRRASCAGVRRGLTSREQAER